uniref:RRP15-like protein n=1 Tax=Oncorhynchus kisutch TaxID=8019 RepID=A0A8C7KUE8_ONCKI
MCFRGRDWETSKDQGKDERSKSSLWTETSVNMSLILFCYQGRGGRSQRGRRPSSSPLVSKKDFINVLRGTEGGSEVVTKTERQTTGREAEEKPAWSVLRDDFMTGASMKDWDKESNKEGEEEEAPGGPEEYNSESD